MSRITGYIIVMNRNKAVWISIAVLIVLFALLDVRTNIEFSQPRESRQLNAEQEARYAACYDARDKYS